MLVWRIKEDALNRVRWRVGVGEVAVLWSGVNPATPVYGDKPGSKIGLIDKIHVINFYLTNTLNAIRQKEKLCNR